MFRCGQRLGRKDNAEKRVCAAVDACFERATKTLLTKPYVGDFDPAAAYKAAPKPGDA